MTLSAANVDQSILVWVCECRTAAGTGTGVAGRTGGVLMRDLEKKKNRSRKVLLSFLLSSSTKSQIDQIIFILVIIRLFIYRICYCKSWRSSCLLRTFIMKLRQKINQQQLWSFFNRTKHKNAQQTEPHKPPRQRRWSQMLGPGLTVCFMCVSAGTQRLDMLETQSHSSSCRPVSITQ